MKDEQPAIDKGCESIEATGTEDVRDCATEHTDRGPPIADGGLRISEFMEALANERRRYLMYYLRDNENAELEEVIEQVAVWKTKTSEELDEQTTKDLRIDLHHVQLPKLEETGIIEYDSRQGSIRFQDLPRPIEEFLDYLASIELSEPIE